MILQSLGDLAFSYNCPATAKRFKNSGLSLDTDAQSLPPYEVLAPTKCGKVLSILIASVAVVGIITPLSSSSVTPAASLISCAVVLTSCCFNPPGLALTSGNPVVSLTVPLDASCLVGLGAGTLVGLVAPSALVGLTCSSAE